MTSKNDLTADWNAGDEYCRFIIEMERKAFEARSRLSDAVYQTDASLTSKFLDDWYESLQNIYDKIWGYMSKENIDGVDTIEKDISTLTKGGYFSNTELRSGNLKDALNLIRAYGREISKFLAHAGIYMKIDVKVNYETAQDELNDRNAGL